MKDPNNKRDGIGVAKIRSWQKIHQQSQFLAKHLAIAQLEKSDNGNDKCQLRPTEIQ